MHTASTHIESARSGSLNRTRASCKFQVMLKTLPSQIIVSGKMSSPHVYDSATKEGFLAIDTTLSSHLRRQSACDSGHGRRLISLIEVGAVSHSYFVLGQKISLFNIYSKDT
jgi:hypothetical protein